MGSSQSAYEQLKDPRWYLAASSRPQNRYDPGEWLLTSITRFRGTAIQMVVLKPTFWLLLGIHFALHYTHSHLYSLPAFDEALMIGLPASLLIFLVVFYGGNCYDRYFNLYNHVSEINALVFDWVLQVAFIYEDAERSSGTPMAARERKLREWMAVRRMLAALHLLFFTVDPEEPKKTCLGRIDKHENPFLGADIHDNEWQELLQRQLLRPAEVERLKRYHGLKFILPVKWALSELAGSLRPQDRMKLQAKNYETLQEIASNFQKRALLMLSVQQQPVPLAYFHLLKLMLVFVNMLISYTLVGVYDDGDVNTLFDVTISTVGYVIIMMMLLGLQEIAISMSDPFGRDDADFDTEQMCLDAYGNAVEYLRERDTALPTFKELECGDKTAARNPLLLGSTERVASVAAAIGGSPNGGACKSGRKLMSA